MLYEDIKEIKDGRIITQDSDFVESEHPRETDGKFTEKGGTGAKSVKFKGMTRSDFALNVEERLKYKIAQNEKGEWEISHRATGKLATELPDHIFTTKRGAKREIIALRENKKEEKPAEKKEQVTSKKEEEKDLGNDYYKNKVYVQKGNDIYEKGGRWYSTVPAWPISPASKGGAKLESEEEKKTKASSKEESKQIKKENYITGKKDWNVSYVLKKGSEDNFINSLTAEEAKAISEYKGDDPYAPAAAIALNGSLREGEKLSKEQEEAVKLLDSAFMKAPRLKEETVLYRGTSSKMDSKNGMIDNKAFMSTSTSKDEAENFSGLTGDEEYLYEITVPKGFAVMPTSSFHGDTSIADESELLLPRGCSLKIISQKGNVIKAQVWGGSAWMFKSIK